LCCCSSTWTISVGDGRLLHTLFSIFASDILPIFVLASIGFLLARFSGVDARAISRVTFNALSPCLIFKLLVTSTISGVDFGRMALFCLLVMASIGVVAKLAASVLQLDRPTTTALMLVVMFSNGGNYGLPVALFAFGTDALAFASVYFVVSSILTYTAGVFIAASGRRSVSQALRGVTQVPTIYAVMAAALIMWLHAPLPDVVLRPVTLLSDAALPLMILVLGMQLERAVRPERVSVVATAVTLSLLVTPVLGWTFATLLGMHGAAFQAAMIQTSMPAAVVTTVLALQYEVAPSFVTSVVVISTLLSPFTLTWIIAMLK
jgi:malate permease and related proteins